MIYFCTQSARRELVLQSSLNGIDFLEVPGDPGCGTELEVTFLKDAQSLDLTVGEVTITGGAEVHPQSIAAATPDDPNVITISLDGTGDFSTYTLTLSAGGLDPQLATIDFSFKAGCATPSDCLASDCCPAPVISPPDINYLAKDYNGFRQVMLDRLAVLLPDRTETHAADLGVAITEVLAYAADHLSYQQDAVSTEAYIGTARSRISLRRHARLVNYDVDEGCNARTFVFVATGTDALTIPRWATFYVGVPGLPVAARSGDPVAQQLQDEPQPAFMALQDVTLYIDHNTISFYTWSASDCCLPKGATAATLSCSLPNLQPGDVLIFEEVLGPRSGQPEDADPARRCAVRLITVTPGVDPLNDAQLTEITWDTADALPFPVCVSSTTDAAHGSRPVADVSVARGNIMPADHGVWVPRSGSEPLGTVPPAPPLPVSTGCNCAPAAPPASVRPRFYPALSRRPLTFAVPFAGVPTAAAFLTPDRSAAKPVIKLHDDDDVSWDPERDLLGSHSTDPVFVPEIESDGTAFLRFGDGRYGTAPEPGLSFSARYRVGNGSRGNIGRDALAHVVLPDGFAHPLDGIVGVRNPLPGIGGVDPESMEHIRRFAPFAYATQRRCVTEADYGQMTTQLTGGLQARGTLRWTGSWYTAFVSIDPSRVTPTVMNEATTGLELLRMMGTDATVESAVIVGLTIELQICVAPGHFRGDVYDALMRIFISGDQCDGRPGLLNATNFSFGETVYASPLVAAAQAVEGVASVTLSTFTRMDAPWVDGVSQGYLKMGRLELPRCDNDPDHLDHGSFGLAMEGGK